MRRKRILLLSNDASSTSSFYRMMRPFEQLSKTMPIDCVVGGNGKSMDWTNFTGVDMVFAMRPGGIGQDSILQRAVDRKIPIIADYDDALLDVPYHHKDFEIYAEEKWRRSAKRSIGMATEVWTTNSDLMANLKSHALFNTGCIIPNAIDDSLFPEPTTPHPMQAKVMMWRGGSSHDWDMWKCAETFKAINEEMPIIFFGSKPWMLTEHIKKERFSYVPSMFDPEEFFRKLQAFSAAFHIVPLVDDKFNRCKSNIAFLEASWFGASRCIVPLWWDTPNINRPYLPGEKLSDMDSGERIAAVLQAQEFIKEKYVLSVTNKQRESRICELLNL